MNFEHTTTKLPASSIWMGHWIFFGAACNVAGWSLSALHQLHAVGLAIAIPLIWFLMARLSGLSLPPFAAKTTRHRWLRRFARLFPAAFLLLAVLTLIGGFLYPPNNFDALLYRMPRVCHWLMEGQWEWIVADKNKLNTRSAGIEWWSAPVIAILRTDRLLFLINWVSFLFLPGLFFSLFRHLGARRKVAAVWMWILPAGYCFVLQAASVGNDMLAAFFAVAAFDYGFRWRRGGSYTSFAMAMACAAMMTAIKPITLPLLLPFAVFFFGMWRPAFSKPLPTAALTVFFALASFLPTAVINIRQCGDWTGAAAEDQKLGSVEPLVGIATNSVNTMLQNASPPVFPLASKWNQAILSLAPKAWLEANARSFEPGGAKFSLSDFQGEEGAGIGFGLSWLLAISMLMAFAVRTPQVSTHSNAGLRRRIRTIAAITFSLALLAYFSRAGMSTVGRHIAPYYPFFFAVLLAGPRQQGVVTSRAWKFFAASTMIMALFLIVISPSRPLWPARTFLSGIDENSPRVLQRAKTGYEVYSTRADGIGPLRDSLPADVDRIALISHSSPAELPLWKPYMKRRVRHVLRTETLETLRKDGITYLALNTEGFEQVRGIAPEAWVGRDGGIVRKRIMLHLLASKQPSEWWLVEIPR
jgi:hypothetical protein